MTIQTLLKEVCRYGEIKIRDGKIRIETSEPLPETLLQKIKQCKALLLKLLQDASNTLPPDCPGRWQGCCFFEFFLSFQSYPDGKQEHRVCRILRKPCPVYLQWEKKNTIH